MKEQHRPFGINQHYHPLRDPTAASPLITDSSSSYYGHHHHHHRSGVSLFSPPSNMNIAPASSSSSPFKPTATLSPYSSPSAAIVRLSLSLLRSQSDRRYFLSFRVFGNNRVRRTSSKSSLPMEHFDSILDDLSC